MLLLMARHGNTFEDGQTPVWVGARTDLPLTTKGREQAASLGEALSPLKPRLKRVLAGPLIRTREHAAIAVERASINASVEIDDRLREIDYGLWEGKPSQDIAAEFSEEPLVAWDKHGIWPNNASWHPDRHALANAISNLANELAAELSPEDAALLVTSNGIARFFLHLVPGLFEDMAAKSLLKVATGNWCAFGRRGGAWSLAFWNQTPHATDLQGQPYLEKTKPGSESRPEISYP